MDPIVKAMEPMIESVENAHVSAITEKFKVNDRRVVDGGVFDAEMRPVLRALNVRAKYLWNFPSLPAGQPERISGNHLYGGFYFNHFGHFVTESLSRLWALDTLDTPVESVLFHPHAPARGLVRRMFDLLRIDLPVRFVESALSVERLFVPAQLHQHDHDHHGHPRFYAWFHDRIAHVAPTSVEKVYVSRAGLKPPLARFAGEAALEASLERAGFTIVRPETLPLAEQVAIYRSADVLLFSEGSAIHLYALSSTKPQRVGVLLRRGGRGMQTHVAEATPNTLISFSPLIRSAHPRGRPNHAITVFDFERLGDMLAEEGFIDRRRWIAPSPDEVHGDYDAACRLLTERFGGIEVFEARSRGDVGARRRQTA